MHTAQRTDRFGSTHLGAARVSGQAGTHSYPYIAYRESNAAAIALIAFCLWVKRETE